MSRFENRGAYWHCTSFSIPGWQDRSWLVPSQRMVTMGLAEIWQVREEAPGWSEFEINRTRPAPTGEPSVRRRKMLRRTGRWLRLPSSTHLIGLRWAGLADLLRQAAEIVMVPMSVAREVLARGPNDVTAGLLAKTSWLVQVDDPEIPPNISGWDLGLPYAHAPDTSLSPLVVRRGRASTTGSFALALLAISVER